MGQSKEGHQHLKSVNVFQEFQTKKSITAVSPLTRLQGSPSVVWSEPAAGNSWLLVVLAGVSPERTVASPVEEGGAAEVRKVVTLVIFPCKYI